MKFAVASFALLAPLFLLSCGTADSRSSTTSQHGNVLAMLGTTTRCAVANRGADSVKLTKISFTYRCEGRDWTMSRDLSVTLWPNSVRNLDVSISPECRTVAPLYCAVEFQ